MNNESEKQSQSVITQFFPSTSNEVQRLQMNNSVFCESTIRSQNEQQLYSAWQTAEAEKQKLYNVILELRGQVNSMKSEIEKLNSYQKVDDTMSHGVPEELSEDDLAEDTRWIRVKNIKKKRKIAETKSPKPSVRSVKKQSNVASQLQSKPTYKPPPIIVTGVRNQEELYAVLDQIVGNEHFQTKLMKNDTVKINVSSEDAYRNLTTELKKLNISWHSYENKQNRDIRVMIKNLHHSFQPVNIINNLRSQGLQAQNATLKLKWKTKEPLDMFIVSFSKNEDVGKIYNIKTICNANVTVEALKSNKLIPQCKTCQSFGHTKNYCNKPPKCVKCAGSHLSSTCNKSENIPPKCCHCGKNHPANYRGCEVIKELQKIRNTKNKSKVVAKAPKARNLSTSKSESESKIPQGSKLYSKVVDSRDPDNIDQPRNSDEMLRQIMQMLQDQNLRLNKIESSIKILNSK